MSDSEWTHTHGRRYRNAPLEPISAVKKPPGVKCRERGGRGGGGERGRGGFA